MSEVTETTASADSSEAVADSHVDVVRSRVGVVISDKMDKTVTVRLQRRVKHPLYGKYITRDTKVHAHDESNECHAGDTVRVASCRPLSKTKAWKVIDIVERAR